MATADRNGPALDQSVVVWQGASATYRVPISDPDSSRPDLSKASAAWWVGGKPVGRGASAFASVAGAPGAFTKSLPIVSDGAGGWQAILTIRAADIAALDPSGLYQHEVWVDEGVGDPYPVTIGPLLIRGTVRGAAA